MHVACLTVVFVPIKLTLLSPCGYSNELDTINHHRLNLKQEDGCHHQLARSDADSEADVSNERCSRPRGSA